MEDSKGNILIDQIVQLSGLPQEVAHTEMLGLLQIAGANSDEITLDELRNAMLVYLETVQREYMEAVEISDLPQA